MPEIRFFIDQSDLGFLADCLNSDPESAFVVPDGVLRNSRARQRLSSGVHLQIEGPEVTWKGGSSVLGKRFEG